MYAGRPSIVALIVTLLSALVLGAGAAPATAQEPDQVQTVCASCHQDLDVAKFRTFQHGDTVGCLSCHHIGFSNDSARVVAERIEACKSCHNDVSPAHLGVTEGAPSCTTCHSIHSDPPIEDAGPELSARCRTCHETRHAIHAGIPNGPNCTDCHTLHGELHPETTDSTLANRCTACHQPHPTHQRSSEGFPLCLDCHSIDGAPLRDATEEQRSDLCKSCHEVHPTHASVKEGAPLCTDCHSVTSDPPLDSVGPAMSRRCATCHEQAMSQYELGGHAAHVDPGTVQTSVRLQATEHCIQCHSNRKLSEKYGLPVNAVASYEDDYHGATLLFLADNPDAPVQPDVLTCEDCHGPHAVGWSNQKAVSQVCLKCHEKGDPKLAGAWLGHAPVGPKNQLVIWLVRLFYFMLIPTVLIGLTLNILFELRHQRAKGARLRDAIEALPSRFLQRKGRKKTMVPRFSVVERLEHAAGMVVFIMLVITGLPQTQPNGHMSHAIIASFGGIGSIRLIHRIMGFTFVALLVAHVARGVTGAIHKRKIPEIVPRPDDLPKALQMLWHRLKGTPAPKIGRFDFAEKFEYWGLFLGGMVMSVTGISLVWPELITTYLPGIVIAVTRTIHGYEATFAVLVVILWHTWGVILRPEVFPLDTSIFTGKISKERLKEEHRAEYDRLFAEGSDAESAGD